LEDDLHIFCRPIDIYLSWGSGVLVVVRSLLDAESVTRILLSVGMLAAFLLIVVFFKWKTLLRRF
jgi:hypothetical protein